MDSSRITGSSSQYYDGGIEEDASSSRRGKSSSSGRDFSDNRASSWLSQNSLRPTTIADWAGEYSQVRGRSSRGPEINSNSQVTIEGLSQLSGGSLNRSDTFTSNAAYLGSGRRPGAFFSEEPSPIREYTNKPQHFISYGEIQDRERINKSAARTLDLMNQAQYRDTIRPMLKNGNIPAAAKDKYHIKPDEVPDVINTYKKMAKEEKERDGSQLSKAMSSIKGWLGTGSR